MQLINSLDELQINERTSVALGNFDGIHIGHQKIMENALESAKDKDLKALCFTFSNHPFNFILGRDEKDPAAVKLICSEEEKISIIRDMGFDILVNVPFDERIMKMRAHDFFEDVLIGRLNAGCISVGFNYSYGARAEGKPEMLKAECAASGTDCIVHDAVTLDGSVISSTLIRGTISEGNMELVSRFLGRPYTVSGRVEHGNRIGSTQGYPTANIPFPEERMAPPNGVHFTHTVIDGTEYESVSNLGSKPTIDSSNRTRSIETYLFGFNGDLYGRDITVRFDHFSRPEVKFGSKDELFEQISRDCAGALEYHRKTLNAPAT